jgi:TPR repeat protein
MMFRLAAGMALSFSFALLTVPEAAAKNAVSSFYYKSALTNPALAYSRLSIRELRANADEGDTAAMVVLGEAAKADKMESYAGWFKNAADKGDPLGMAFYGEELARSGKLPEGLALLEKAADKGSPIALDRLSRLALDGKVSLPPEAYERWILSALPHDHFSAFKFQNLREWEQTGAIAPGFVDGMMERLSARADAGDETAAFAAGFCREFRVAGQDKDLEQAAFWYKKAAAAGFLPACWRLYLLYNEMGDGQAGRAWLQQAARNGDIVSLLQSAGNAFHEQPGNPVLAAELLRKADASGSILAARRLAYLYRSGALPGGGPEAVKWLERAAEVGDHGAWAELAAMYQSGEGVPQDTAKSAELWARVAHDQAFFDEEARSLLTP